MDYQVKFEYLGEDKDYPLARKYQVEALHVTTTRNKRKFTESELLFAGRSLSFRPLNINHDTERQLAFPENATLAMNYVKESRCVSGTIRVMDPGINASIESGFIRTVSIEQIPTLGETCNEVICEQHGVAFIGLALLEDGIIPGDTDARILKESSGYATLGDMIIADEQRKCVECTDYQKCHTCKHKEMYKEVDQAIQVCLDDLQRTHPEMPQENRVVHCLEQLNRVEPSDKFKNITITLNEQNDCMEDNIKEIKSEHPDWERDQVIAVALKKCGLSRNEMIWYFYNIAKENYVSN